MNEKTLYKTLTEIANKGTQKHADPWPLIRMKIKNGQEKNRSGSSRRFIFVLVAIAVLTTAAGIVILLMDTGLQKADESGLVAHLNQTAKPTVFTNVPANLAANNSISQTQNGISVTLNWAYADELRVAWQLTITGLSIPQDSNVENYVCTPYVTTQEGIILKPALSQEKRLSDQPGDPIIISYNSFQDINAEELSNLNIHLDLTVGPCGNPSSSDGWYLGSRPIPTPVPLIGTYHLNFQVPVNTGRKIVVDKTTEASGVQITLKSVTVSPSYTIAEFCYPNLAVADLSGNMRADWNWWLQGTTIQFGDEDPILYSKNSYFSLPEENNGDSSQQCQSLGFAATADMQARNISLSIGTMQAVEYSAAYMNLLTQKNAVNALTQQGIKVKFGWNGKSYWTIIEKPTEMTEEQADQIVENLVWHTIHGPWKFTVDLGENREK